MLEKLKSAVCDANKLIFRKGLVILSWGNVSAIDRKSGLVVIKPSGVAFESLTPNEMVVIDLEGNVVEGSKRPSIDTPTHLELYKSFKNIGAVIHTHSTNATIFSQAKKPIRCFGTTHADHFYGSVPVTRDLTKLETESDYEKNVGKVIVELFEKESIDPDHISACLVASHGPFVWGENLACAVDNALALEQVAEMKLKMFYINRSPREIPKHLLDKHYKRKHGKKAYYGQDKRKS